MIESIRIVGVASYGQEVQALDGLTKFNFIYGANGCGKTTISRVIDNPTRYPSCHVGWKSGVPLQAMVYNRDFVARNFGPSAGSRHLHPPVKRTSRMLPRSRHSNRSPVAVVDASAV